MLFDQKMLISKGKMVKTATFFWPPSAAGFFVEFFDQKIVISKGEMVKTAKFSGAPAARQKNFGPLGRNLASDHQSGANNPPLVSPYF